VIQTVRAVRTVSRRSWSKRFVIQTLGVF